MRLSKVTGAEDIINFKRKKSHTAVTGLFILPIQIKSCKQDGIQDGCQIKIPAQQTDRNEREFKILASLNNLEKLKSCNKIFCIMMHHFLKR